MPAIVFGAPIDLVGNEVRNASLQQLGTAPTSSAGRYYLDTSVSPYVLRYYNGTDWVGLDGLSVTALASLTDVDLTGLTAGNVLHWDHDAGKWFAVDPFSWSVTDLGSATADLDMDLNKIVNVGDPSDPDDATTVAWVQNAIEAVEASIVAAQQGLDPKESVTVLATTNVDGLGSYIDPPTIDGVLMVPGMRVLCAGQTDPTLNGLYLTHEATGPTADPGQVTIYRSADASSPGELSIGSMTFVEHGTAHAGQLWICTDIDIDPDDPADLWVAEENTTTWTQLSGAVSITAGDGLTSSGNTFAVGGTTNRISVSADAVDIDSAYVGQTSITTLGTVATGTWSATAVDIAHGGTGATTAAAARTALAVPGKYAVNIGDGSTTTITVTHNLNTKDVGVSIRDTSTDAISYADVVAATVNTVTVGFTTAPASNAYRVTVMG